MATYPSLNHQFTWLIISEMDTDNRFMKGTHIGQARKKRPLTLLLQVSEIG